jgi:predicted DNA-binding transcriptional regulator YafY
MKGSGSKLGVEVVKKLMGVGDKQGTIKLTDLAAEMGLSTEDALVFLREWFPEGGGVEIYSSNNEALVDIDASSLEYMLPLSPSEWLGLSQLVQNLGPSELQKIPALKSLYRKMTENEAISKVMGLLQELESWDQEINQKQQSFVDQLESAIESKSQIGLVTTHHKNYQVLPCKVIHLEGRLSLIAEDMNDHCLLVVPMIELMELTTIQSTKSPRVTAFEVDEFIVAIRSMSEKETRLILKIHDPQSVNLFPNHHFLGKPCMITNPQGDLIWAAYVEPCDDLFEWLISLNGNVEILDPTKFKDDFLMYCEEKLRKVA